MVVLHADIDRTGGGAQGRRGASRRMAELRPPTLQTVLRARQILCVRPRADVAGCTIGSCR